MENQSQHETRSPSGCDVGWCCGRGGEIISPEKQKFSGHKPGFYTKSINLNSTMKKINVILKEASGMVGEGVLKECNQNERVSKVFRIFLLQIIPIMFSHP